MRWRTNVYFPFFQVENTRFILQINKKMIDFYRITRIVGHSLSSGILLLCFYNEVPVSGVYQLLMLFGVIFLLVGDFYDVREKRSQKCS